MLCFRVIVLVLMRGCFSLAEAQERLREVVAAEPLVIGQTFSLISKALGEPRRLNVYLPPGYAELAMFRLPVLYMPDLFDTYLAFDPSLWWNNEQLANQASTLFQAQADQPKTLYLATGGDAGIDAPARRLTQALGGKIGRKIIWHYEPMPQETYATIYHPAALKAFRLVFKPQLADSRKAH